MSKIILCLMIGAAFLGGALRADATIDPLLQMQLGNPSGAGADPNNHSHYLIQRAVEALDYNDYFGEPNWASWDLTAADLGSSGRSPDFLTDTNLPATFYEVTTADYSGAGYDRGHMCPSADRTDSDADNEEVFLLSNIIPQAASNNSGVWGTFEGYCRSLAQSGDELLVICGPSGFNGSLIQPSQRVFVPAYTWKVVVVVPPGAGSALSRITAATRVIAVKIPNNNSVGSAWSAYVTSARQIEVDTGFTFFTALPSDVASALRNKVDGSNGSAPALTGFSPPDGAVGDGIILAGGGFSSASAVTFNGVNAPFVVNSPAQITATVPANAVSGPVSVTTPAGTAVSSNAFSVTGSTVDLAVTETHFGNFSQGDTGDTYTINVTNVGTLTTTNSVTVADFLPPGLTATALAGVGWTVDWVNLTCTRATPLIAGAGYPPLVLTVNVSTNAPASVTNSVALSAAADVNAANNSASDVTAINAAAAGGPVIILAAWDMHGLPGGLNNFGVSPFPPATIASHVTVGGLIRAAGVGTNGTAAARGWGGASLTNTTAAAAIAANCYFTFTLAAQTGQKISFASLSPFAYRRSSTGAGNGLLQYQLGAGAFMDISSFAYPSNTSTGGFLSPLNLAGIAALQNIGAGTNVTFRLVNYNGGSSAGTWYIYDVANTSDPDFVVQGTVLPATAPDLAVSLTHAGNFTQGDASDVYVITVTNLGDAATIGTVSVADALPAGLSLANISGAGWIADPDTLTCARSESLAPGTAYPPITLAVTVATNAPAALTNVVTVSLAGDGDLTNNIATDSTSIIALSPIQLWRLQWFGVTGDSGTAADTAVSTSDGLPNLLKYAYGLDPLVAAADPFAGDLATGYLRVTLPKNPAATDVVFQIERTADLQTPWTTNGIVIDQNTPSLLQAHDTSPVTTSGSDYIRLQVIRP